MAVRIPAAYCEPCIHLRRQLVPDPEAEEGVVTTDELVESCAAFPDGIPQRIRMGRYDHTRPHPGDHGIRREVRGDL